MFISESILGVGNSHNTLEENKAAGLNTVIMSGVIVVLANLIYYLHDYELKRTQFEKESMEAETDDKDIYVWQKI